jgi:hypothetical protein
VESIFEILKCPKKMSKKNNADILWEKYFLRAYFKINVMSPKK